MIEEIKKSIGVYIDFDAPLFDTVRDMKAPHHTDFLFKKGDRTVEISKRELVGLLGL